MVELDRLAALGARFAGVEQIGAQRDQTRLDRLDVDVVVGVADHSGIISIARRRRRIFPRGPVRAEPTNHVGAASKLIA